MANDAKATKAPLSAVLRYTDCTAAVTFLTEVFGFTEGNAFRDDSGKVMHAELHFGNGLIMIGPVADTPFGKMMKQPREAGGVTISLFAVVNDPDGSPRALESGRLRDRPAAARRILWQPRVLGARPRRSHLDLWHLRSGRRGIDPPQRCGLRCPHDRHDDQRRRDREILRDGRRMVGPDAASSGRSTSSTRCGWAISASRCCGHFGRDGAPMRPFEGLRFLDIGCGGGLLSEPMARLGATVVGADAAERNIRIAELHAEQSGLDDRLSRDDGRSAGGRGRTVRHRPQHGSGRARRQRAALHEELRRPRGARRAAVHRHHQPHRSARWRSPSSAPSTCWAGCPRARTTGRSS